MNKGQSRPSCRKGNVPHRIVYWVHDLAPYNHKPGSRWIVGSSAMRGLFKYISLALIAGILPPPLYGVWHLMDPSPPVPVASQPTTFDLNLNLNLDRATPKNARSFSPKLELQPEPPRAAALPPSKPPVPHRSAFRAPDVRPAAEPHRSSARTSGQIAVDPPPPTPSSLPPPRLDWHRTKHPTSGRVTHVQPNNPPGTGQWRTSREAAATTGAATTGAATTGATTTGATTTRAAAAAADASGTRGRNPAAAGERGAVAGSPIEAAAISPPQSDTEPSSSTQAQHANQAIPSRPEPTADNTYQPQKSARYRRSRANRVRVTRRDTRWTEHFFDRE